MTIRVLLIEDSIIATRQTQKMLAGEKSAQFDVELKCADRLSVGLKHISEDKFDVILLDLTLSDSEGLNTFTSVQAQAPRVPIIVFSSLEDETLATTAVHKGAQDYLVKGKVNSNLLKRCILYAVERKKIEEALSNSEERFRGIAERSIDIIFEMDLEGRFTYVSPATEIVTGHETSEIVGKLCQDLLTESGIFGFTRSLNELSKGKSVTSQEFEITKKDGTLAWLEMNASPILTNSELVKVQGILRDITQRKEAESTLARQAQALSRANTDLIMMNEELEAFCYSVSHDLRAPLRSIDGFSQALLEDYIDELDAQGKDYLNRVRAGAQRMGELIDDLLTLSRVTRTNIEKQPVDLSALAHNIAAQLGSEQPERQVEFIITDGVTTNGDPGLLRAALENLLGNAWKFTSKHPNARIEFGTTQVDNKTAVFVRDNGAGFDMAYVDKLFSPFQRLHGNNEFPGNGIGLATVQRIIHRHGGNVWAEGILNEGATFYFTLSLVHEKERTR
jgi:PAS domain S-box-containing protein